MQKPMTKFCCDAPDCGVSVIVDEATLVGVGTWDQIEIDGKELSGCCETHLAAAVLASIGMMPAARTLLLADKVDRLNRQFNPNQTPYELEVGGGLKSSPRLKPGDS